MQDPADWPLHQCHHQPRKEGCRHGPDHASCSAAGKHLKTTLLLKQWIEHDAVMFKYNLHMPCLRLLHLLAREDSWAVHAPVACVVHLLMQPATSKPGTVQFAFCA